MSLSTPEFNALAVEALSLSVLERSELAHRLLASLSEAPPMLDGEATIRLLDERRAASEGGLMDATSALDFIGEVRAEQTL